MVVGVLLLIAAAWPASSPLRAKSGALTAAGAPLMDAIVPLIFLLFLLPGLVTMMLPYSLIFLAGWTFLLLGFWALDIPLGLQARYTYP